ncbi:MAG: TRAP transporter small permease subunit [Treponema sp.]|nr:TRAP transporter small permease subunit [Treponema sp.]
MGVLRRAYRFLCKAEIVICCIGFMFLITFVFLSAILRFFRVSMSWNIDLAMLLLAWTAFLGADIAWRSGQLAGVDLVTRNLPSVLQKIFQILVYLIITAALLVIFVYGIRLMWTERVRTYQSMPIPYSLVTLSLVIAAISMVCSTVIKIRRCIMDSGKKE